MMNRKEKRPATPQTQYGSMTVFIDFMMSSGPKKVSLLADFKQTQHTTITDFYRPIREALMAIHLERRDPDETFGALMRDLRDARGLISFPEIIKGHKRFLARHKGASAFEPATGALHVRRNLAIAINPELGLVIDGVPTHVKLWLRSMALSQARVNLTIALMSRLRVPEGHKLAMLDVRQNKLRYLDAESHKTGRWRRLETIINIERAAYAAGWDMV